MKVILFDIDDTLISCDEVNNKSSRVMFKKIFNLDVEENKINKWGKTEKGIIREVITTFGDFSKDIEIPNEAFITWAAATKKLLKEKPPKILPGIKELLEELFQDPEIIIGLLTGNSRLRSAAKLKAANIEKYFLDEHYVLKGVFGDTTDSRGELIPMIKQKFGDGKYILIDDSIIAGKAAQENNIACILVATGKASLDELKEYTPHVFGDFGENKWQQVIKIIHNI